MHKNKEKDLIKQLLTEKLTVGQRKCFADMEGTQAELKRQWEEAGKTTLDFRLKTQLWQKISKRCGFVSSSHHPVRRWLAWAAASVAGLLVMGYWLLSMERHEPLDDFLEVIADQKQVYVLPDSSKVWMEPGSRLRYPRMFRQNRQVWLCGNALFEVEKLPQQAGHFRVHTGNAFIEVTGTSFLVEQDHAENSEVLLFNGSIEFHIEPTDEVIYLAPMQKVSYNPQKAEAHVVQLPAIGWNDGRFSFRKIPLEELVDFINRMYRADIVLQKQLKGEVAFSGSIRYEETLDEVLDKLCFSLGLVKKKGENRIVLE